MDRLEVWHSERGRHVPPDGHAFALDSRAGVHLVDLDAGTDLDRQTLCNIRVLPPELVFRARGELCDRCANGGDRRKSDPGIAPLRWVPVVE